MALVPANPNMDSIFGWLQNVFIFSIITAFMFIDRDELFLRSSFSSRLGTMRTCQPSLAGWIGARLRPICPRIWVNCRRRLETDGRKPMQFFEFRAVVTSAEVEKLANRASSCAINPTYAEIGRVGWRRIHDQTGLCLQLPDNREIYREFCNSGQFSPRQTLIAYVIPGTFRQKPLL